MSKKLGNDVKTLTVTIIVNADKSDTYIKEKIAEALDLNIEAIYDEPVESLVAERGWIGDISYLYEGLRHD